MSLGKNHFKFFIIIGWLLTLNQPFLCTPLDVTVKFDQATAIVTSDAIKKMTILAPSPQYVVRYVPTKEKLVALTFDDGPNPHFTPLVLKLLKEHGAKATFFLLGNHLAKYPELANEIKAAGHEIGNHTYTHPRFNQISTSQALTEIGKSQWLFYNKMGFCPTLFRPPYGSLRPAQYQAFKQYFGHIILWSVDSKDYRGDMNHTNVENNVLHNIHPGVIILMHDTSSRNYEALPNILQELETKGYRLVTVSDLLLHTSTQNPTIRSKACYP